MSFKRIFIYLIASLLILEITARISMLILFNVPLHRPADLRFHFYPELRLLDDYHYDEDRINLLVLAGSVMAPDTFILDIRNKKVETHFCSLEDVLDPGRFNIINLSQSGHNSLDSWYKYQYVDDQFDYVFIYHGINDSRVNNISRDEFDPNYRHIEFYDDLFIVNRHINSTMTSLPFIADWLLHSVRKKNNFYIPKEMFPGLLKGEPEAYVLEGREVKSKASFKNNIQRICDRATNSGAAPILSHYAYYLPDNYSLDSFNLGELDYGQQIFPVELYGLPANVLSALQVHESAIDELITANSSKWLDANTLLPKNSAYFHDICHITDAGCALIANQLSELVAQ